MAILNGNNQVLCGQPIHVTLAKLDSEKRRGGPSCSLLFDDSLLQILFAVDSGGSDSRGSDSSRGRGRGGSFEGRGDGRGGGADLLPIFLYHFAFSIVDIYSCSSEVVAEAVEAEDGPMVEGPGAVRAVAVIKITPINVTNNPNTRIKVNMDMVKTTHSNCRDDMTLPGHMSKAATVSFLPISDLISSLMT